MTSRAFKVGDRVGFSNTDEAAELAFSFYYLDDCPCCRLLTVKRISNVNGIDKYHLVCECGKGHEAIVTEDFLSQNLIHPDFYPDFLERVTERLK